MRSETELLVDPKLFLTLRERMLVSEVDIELKRGATESEMTRFRYDVILRTGDRSNRGSEFQLDGPVPLSEVARMLRDERPESLRIVGVLNARVAGEVAALESLAVSARADELKELIAARAGEGIRPDEWWQLGEEAGYRAEVCWSDRPSYYDVLYWREERPSLSFDANGHFVASRSGIGRPHE